MKPFKMLAFFFIIMLLLAGLGYLIPDEGLRLGDDVRIYFPRPGQILHPDTLSYKDISEITQKFEQDQYESGDTGFFHFLSKPPAFDSIFYDTLFRKQIKAPLETRKKESYTFTLVKEPLQYPQENKNILYPVFNQLKAMKGGNQKFRILHYGDSQIEGDRISSFLRKKLQDRFGGYGVGLVPAVWRSSRTVSLNQSLSENWERYTIGDYRKKKISDQQLGLLMEYSRFGASGNPAGNDEQKALIHFEKSSVGYYRASHFNRCRIFYGGNNQPFIMQLYHNTRMVDADMISPQAGIQAKSWDFDQLISQLTFHFTGADSPHFYGVSFESKNGVLLDNIPVRGSSGTDFTRTDQSFFREMISHMEVELILLQFGVNVVPTQRNSYDFYERALYRQLQFLKQVNPGIKIIVMGVSDMSTKNQSGFISYPNIEKIRDAQKKAAFKAGCVFWDTYEAMGGKNSMPSWVFHDPPLARKDFTHFTFKGSKMIAQLFYNAFISEYESFLSEKE